MVRGYIGGDRGAGLSGAHAKIVCMEAQEHEGWGGTPTSTDIERFWERVDRQPGASCWLWTGTPSNSGYGQLGFDGVTQTAHRVAWQISRGRSIPDGYTVGHACHDEAVALGECPGGEACRHRLCVRPDHLCLQTQQVNNAAKAPIGKCPHEKGAAKSNCPECRSEKSRKEYQRNREVLAAARALGLPIGEYRSKHGSDPAVAQTLRAQARGAAPERRDRGWYKDEVQGPHAIRRAAAAALGMRVTDYIRIHGQSVKVARDFLRES